MRHGGGPNRPVRRRTIITAAAAIVGVAAIAAGVTLYNTSAGPAGTKTGPLPDRLPTTSGAYLGVYTNGSPASYGGVTAFTNATGARRTRASRWPRSSGREPETEPALLNTSAAALVTLAARGLRPTARSAG